MKITKKIFVHLHILAFGLTSCFDKQAKNLINTTTPSNSKMEAMNVPVVFE